MRAITGLAVVLLLAGCNDPLCVALECQDELTLTIYQIEGEPIAAGEYDISITWGSHSEPKKLDRVTVTTPEDTCECSGGGATCNGDGQLVIDLAPHMAMEDGFADDPSEITVFVHSDEALIGQENINPMYEKYWCRPDHDQCNDQENYTAEVTLVVEMP